MSVTIQDAALQRQKDTNRLGVNPACTFQCLKAESDTVYTPPTLQQDDGPPSGWKPLSLSAPILSAVAILSLLIAAAVEVLAQKSSQDGGLALSASQDDIPRYAMIFYLYGPNVVAVLYSLIWSWIDLDTKRMQPWFELSKPNGATAANSLFLDYPYDFVAFVPWKAAKRKHWPVMLSGLTMVLVFWVVTPLQSAVLGLGSVSVLERVNITTRGRLVDVGKQQELLDPRVLSTGYAIGWLGQPYPSFMTSEYALLPFYVDDADAAKGGDRNLTAKTTKLWTDLDCWPAEVKLNGSPVRMEFDFLNGQGCNATINMARSPPYSMLYVGYYPSTYSDFALMGDACPETENSTHQFLAIWAETEGVTTSPHPKINITALYCQPSYYKQDITATVSSSTLEPYDELQQQVSSKSRLSEHEFNSTAFEYLIANGMGENFTKRDFPFNAVIEQHPRLADTNLSQPVSNMIGFALAGQTLPVSEYAKSGNLHAAFERAHRSLFSIAVSYLASNQSSFASQTAFTTTMKSGVIVSRPIAAALEAVVFGVGIASFVLLWLCRAAPSNLPANPASIARISEIFRSSCDVLDLFSSHYRLSQDQLKKLCRGHRFRLTYTFKDGQPIPYIAMSFTLSSNTSKGDVIGSVGQEFDPLLLKQRSGMILIIIFLSLITTLSLFQWQIDKNNGLARPTDNFEILQLLENYIPTIIATFIEPFWVLLNRYLCVLQPFRVLSKGHASQLDSVDTTYTAIPSQLSLWRAMKNSHYLLVSLCSMALLSNVLSVGLGALFNEAPTMLTTSTEFHPLLSDRLSKVAVQNFSMHLSRELKTTSIYPEHMYIQLANMTLGTPLPPWATPEYFFQPFSSAPGNKTFDIQDSVVLSRGFGMHITCTAIEESKISSNISEPPNRFDNLSSCPDFTEIAKSRMRHSTLTRSSGPSSIEYSNTLSGDLIPCDGTLTFGWGRTLRGEDANASATASFALCKPILQTGLFKVKVTRRGYVQSYEQLGVLQLHTDSTSADMIIHANHLINSQNIQWHNDTLSQSWMSYFIVEKLGSRKLLDPEEPVPNPQHLIPTLESIHRSLFAILLSQNQHLFAPATSRTSKGETSVSVTRIFMDRPAFIVSVVVLCLNLIVAVTLYARLKLPSLPHMPSTIASIVAYLAGSRGIKIYGQPTMGLNLRTVGFGKYIGRDGYFHVGIELEPYVVSQGSRLLGA